MEYSRLASWTVIGPNCSRRLNPRRAEPIARSDLTGYRAAESDHGRNPVKPNNEPGLNPDTNRSADFIPGRNSTDRPERM